MDAVNTQDTNEGVDRLSHINYTGLLPVLVLFVIIIARVAYELCKSGRQKTRNPQQRRMYAASRARPSISQAEPTIYVSPTNLPPPPKYEALAPPSYEEVVGVHYPNYQVTQIQPITQPITTAMAQSTQIQPINQPITTAMAQSTLNATENTENNVNVRNNDVPATIITVTTEQRRTSVAVAQS